MRGQMFTAVTKHINEVCLLPSGFVCFFFQVNFYDDERGETCSKYLKNCKCKPPSQCIVRSQRLVMIEWKGKTILGQQRRSKRDRENEENIWSVVEMKKGRENEEIFGQ